MKKDELKAMLSPIVKELLKEMILQPGFLSTIIKECNVANGATIVNEQRFATPRTVAAPTRDPMVAIQEAKRRLDKSLGSEVYQNIFEGITPIAPESSPEASNYMPSSGLDPSDPGISLENIPFLRPGSFRKI